MMRFAQCSISANHSNQSNILDPVYIDFNEQNRAKQCDTFQHPDNDVIFSHLFIASEIDKYGLTQDGCAQCSQVTAFH